MLQRMNYWNEATLRWECFICNGLVSTVKEEIPKNHKCKEMKIIVNGIDTFIKFKKLSYEMVVFLANKDTYHKPTVTYKKEKDNGTLISGQYITIEQGMNFNVSYTGGS